MTKVVYLCQAHEYLFIFSISPEFDKGVYLAEYMNEYEAKDDYRHNANVHALINGYQAEDIRFKFVGERKFYATKNRTQLATL